jgi:hypothetical protein
MLSVRVFPILLLVLSCAPAAPPPVAPPASEAPEVVVPAECAAVDQRIIELARRVFRTDAKALDLPASVAELTAIWQHRCLAHLARFFPPPKPTTARELETLFQQDLVPALRANLGKREFAVPPVLLRPLSESARKALAPWLCSEPGCGARAQSYIARAEEAFDASELLQAEKEPDLCRGMTQLSAEEAKKMTPFESWAGCIIAEAPWTHRFASLRYRAPERGWLVLRGRRGHYEFADEIRAYDLETGSAYVSSSASALVLDGPEVDHAAADEARRPEAYTGKVVAEQVRELAFALVTLSAVTPMRTRVHSRKLPSGVRVELATGPMPPAGPMEWETSAQTGIGFSLIEDEKLIAEGTFTYPDSSHAAEDHANTLLRVLEAGLERRCAPAKLPASVALGPKGKVSTLDADPARQDRQMTDLAKALEQLRPCP